VPDTIENYLTLITEQTVKTIFTAGRSNQQAHEWQGQGLFTFFFLEGLRGGADANRDGIITSAELFAFLEPNVAQTSLANWRAEQTPQMARSGQGEFIFRSGVRIDIGKPLVEQTPSARPPVSLLERAGRPAPTRRSPDTPPPKYKAESGRRVNPVTGRTLYNFDNGSMPADWQLLTDPESFPWRLTDAFAHSGRFSIELFVDSATKGDGYRARSSGLSFRRITSAGDVCFYFRLGSSATSEQGINAELTFYIDRRKKGVWSALDEGQSVASWTQACFSVRAGDHYFSWFGNLETFVDDVELP
jgi:hypothetical protein